MGDLTALAWALLGVAAIVVGISKTALPGSATLAVAIFAVVLPARSSTATLLVLLIVGDALALLLYRRHAEWATLLRLAPAVVGGIVVGALFLAFADDTWVRKTIAVILLAVVGFTLWLRRRDASPLLGKGGVAVRAGYGTLAGFTTMVANAGGPVMSMYFLAARFEVKAFLGTAAWFFAIVNIAKLPVAIGLGLLTAEGLVIDLLLAPVVVAGALAGRLIANRIDQALFERIVFVLTVIAAVYLLVS